MINTGGVQLQLSVF